MTNKYLASRHKHLVGDITTTNGPSATTFLRGDGQWIVPTNTTYTALALAEAQTGTASTARAVSAALLKQIISWYVTGSASTLPGAFGQQLAQAANAAAAKTALNITVADVINLQAALDAKVAKGELVINVKDYGAKGDGTTDDLAAINEALAAGVVIYFPEGNYIVSDTVVVPPGKHIYGAYSQIYTAVPTVGARLKRALNTSTSPVVELSVNSKITDMAVIGASTVSAAHNGIFCMGRNIIRDVTIANCLNGIDGNYKGAIRVETCQIHGNVNSGLINIVDSVVYMSYFNVNGTHGINLQAGANDNVIVGCKLEWNKGHGLNMFENKHNVISDNNIDRNGRAGIAMVSVVKSIFGDNILRRNGRTSSGVANDDVHFYMQNCSDNMFTGIVTETGPDDDTTGYISPARVIRAQGGADNTFMACDFSGFVTEVVGTITAGTNIRYIGVKGVPDSISVSKASIGLDQVDNTSDANKPISTAQAAGLLSKQAANPGTNRVYVRNSSNADTAVPYGSAATPSAMVIRDGNGRAKFADGVAADDTASKGQMDAALAGKAPVVDGRVPAVNLPTTYRTTDTQPFAADSIWNTPIGDATTFESATDLPTANLLAATPVINDNLNGYGFHLNPASATDPMGTGSYTGTGGNTITFTHRMPYDPVISGGTDGSMRIVDGRYAYDYWKTTKVDDTTYTAEFITRTDLLGTGRNAGTRAARFPTAGGLIRTHEIAKCFIPHALCISIPPAALKRGFVWPAAAEDAAGVNYTGNVPMGSFFAIPRTVDINTLGLTPEGYALAECLQNYGMYVGDASTTAAISAEGQAALEMRPAVDRMRSAWTALFPLMRRVTNVDSTAGGPGTRVVPPTGPVSIEANPLSVEIDRLQTRLRLLSGVMLTSDTGRLTGASLAQTDALLGGVPMAWTQSVSQFQRVDGLLKRIDTPDGASRALGINVGRRDHRVEMRIESLPAPGTNLSIMVRAVNISNAYRLTISDTGAASISKNVGGTVTTLPGSGVAAGIFGPGITAGLLAYGPRLFALADGDVVAEVTDTSLTVGTEVGVTYPPSLVPTISVISVHTVPRLSRKP